MSFERKITRLVDTQSYASRLAQLVQPKDIITLKGDLGTGKTEFARSLIRFFMGEDYSVPSPTFNLVQIYNTPEFPLWHLDLYRLKHPEEVWELGLEEAFHEGVVLLEWPERLPGHVLKNHLEILFYLDPKSRHRTLTFNPDSAWETRLAELEAL